MIVTVTPNPAIDLTYQVDTFLAGESLRVDRAGMRAGGKGVNVARVVAGFGEPVLAIATAGGASGREFADDLRASGIAHRLVPVTAATRRTVAILDRATGSTTILNERGGALSDAECDALAAAAREALLGYPRDEPARGEPARGDRVFDDRRRGRPGCLVVSGSLPPGMPDTFCADLVRFAHEAGVPAVVDAVGPALLAAASAGADVVKPNSAELSLTTGVTDPIDGARILLEHGARLALVSLGADGMLAVTSEKALHARLPRPLEGNPTGAGDAAVAAVAVHLAHGDDDLLAMLERATAWSAAAVLRPLAGEIADDAAELQHLVTTTDA